MGHDYFNSKAKATTTPGLEKLQDLYVARSYHLWKEPEVILFLETATHNVLRRVDARDEYANFCRSKRAIRYQGQPPRNVLRHIILSDFKEVTVSHHAVRKYSPFASKAQIIQLFLFSPIQSFVLAINSRQRYSGSKRPNIISEVTKFSQLLCQQIRDTGPIFSYDPLPPADSVDIYQRERTVQRPAQTNSNLFSLFMSSLYTDLEGNIPNIALNGFEL